MKKIVGTILFACVLTLGFAATTEKESAAGFGSCYEVAPICIGSAPVCMCNQFNNCFWACR